MSYFFRMAVFQTATSPGVDELMAPYRERIRVEPYMVETRAEALDKAREIVTMAKEIIDNAGKGCTGDWEEAVAAHFDDSDEELLEWYVVCFKRGCTCDEEGYLHLITDPPEWGDYYELDEEGNCLSTHNPKSQGWYRYEIAETLTFDEWLRSGTDLTGEENLRRKSAARIAPDDDLCGEGDYIELSGDEDHVGDYYVKPRRIPVGWGVVTPDGEWYEPDLTREGCEDWVEHFNERFVEPYDPNATTVVMVDCHY